MIVKTNNNSNRTENGYNILSQANIVIPTYQRDFETPVKKISWLVNDVIKIAESGDSTLRLFINNLIRFEEDDGDNKRTNLVDGQQRLVSLNVLIKAFNELLQEKKDEVDSKVQPIDYIKIQYLDAKMDNSYKKGFVVSNIGNYRKILSYFKEELSNHLKSFPEIREVIVKKVSFYSMLMMNEDEAIEEFNITNAGGTQLNAKEILKTAVLDAIAKYDVKFEDIDPDDLIEALSAYNKSSQEEFISSEKFAVLTYFKNKVACSKDELQKFVDFYNKIKKIKTTREWCQMINSVSKKQLSECFYVFANTHLYDKDSTRNSYQAEFFTLLVIYSYIFTIKNIQGTLPRKFYTEVIRILKKELPIVEAKKQLIQAAGDELKISKKELIYSFTNGRSVLYNNYKQILRMIILYDNKSIEFCYTNITGEHCYPKNPAPKWADEGWVFINSNEQNRITHSIGNIFLLEGNDNQKASAKYIDDKVSVYEATFKNGLLNHEINRINPESYRHGMKKGIDAIDKRCEAIVEYILNNIPSVKNIIIED